ncbi:OapA family protein [Pseudomonas graminis]
MPNASLTSRLPSWFNRLWHLPDQVRWMDPLPPQHRRGIIAAVLVILLAFLWPAPSPQHIVTPMQSGSSATEVPLQAELTDAPPPPTATQQPPQQDDQGTWGEYTIASGQTLAQLFRDNNLPVNDVFAMAQVEGNDKPLSSLHAGQTVKIRQNAQAIVTGLTLEGPNGEILFTRQPDGTFLKAN